MLKPMCRISTCVKVLVISCHQAPSLTPLTHSRADEAVQTASLCSWGKYWFGLFAGTQRPVGSSASRAIQALAAPPVAMISSQTAALMPISTIEVILALPGRSPPYAVRPLRVDRDPSCTQEG